MGAVSALHVYVREIVLKLYNKVVSTTTTNSENKLQLCKCNNLVLWVSDKVL